MTKSTHCGLACSLGVDAALLAARGFGSHMEILETPRGYVDMMFGGKFDYEMVEKFGPPLRVVTPSYAIKMFPSQFGTHFVITAGLELHKKIGDPKRIRSCLNIVSTDDVRAFDRGDYLGRQRRKSTRFHRCIFFLPA